MGEIKYRTLRENVLDAIRLKILEQELKPGARIIEQEIAEEFGVSRGPIREAFRQLEHEGLVVYTRNVGCSVKEITFDDLFEVYMMRGTYELIAIKSFKGAIPDATLKKMENILEQMKEESTITELIINDNLFHETIIEATEMQRLLKAWKDLDYAIFLNCYIDTSDTKTITARQYRIHKDIYDVYCSGDTKAICKIIKEHYASALKRTMEDSGLSKESFKFSTDIMDTII